MSTIPRSRSRKKLLRINHKENSRDTPIVPLLIAMRKKAQNLERCPSTGRRFLSVVSYVVKGKREK